VSSPSASTGAATVAAERLGAALVQLEGRGPGAELDAARDMVREILALHGAAMARLVEIAEARGAAGRAILAAMADDDLVGNILALHGVHPVALERRVRAALDRLAPVAAGRGASFALVELGAEALVLSLAAERGGAAELGRLAEDAICAAAPDAPPIRIATAPRPEGLVPVERLVAHARAAAEQPAGALTAPAPDRCELCGAPIAEGHPHLVDPAARALVCACPACHAVLGEAGGRWRRVPRRARALPDFRVDEAAWGDLGIPVEMAFFVESSAAGRVIALYPGPAGVTESLLPLTAWQGLLAGNGGFTPLEPDVEALLVRRARGAYEPYRVSIDVAYELAGVLRRRWRGLSGGAEARGAVDAFFAQLTSPPGGSPCSG
jgi:hypothetical protein